MYRYIFCWVKAAATLFEKSFIFPWRAERQFIGLNKDSVTVTINYALSLLFPVCPFAKATEGQLSPEALDLAQTLPVGNLLVTF